jgi:RNA-binding protein 5/10
MQFLISPVSQPNGFVIADFPIAASFMNPSTFVPRAAGPLGSEFLLRASRNGGIGSSTIDGQDGQWVAYWHEQSGTLETVPRNALKVRDDGTLEPITSQLRAFLGGLAGPVSGVHTSSSTLQQTTATSATGPISFSLTGMTAIQPIKISSKGKGVEGGIGKKLLDDDDDVRETEDKDSVLLSRSQSFLPRFLGSTVCSPRQPKE